MPDAAPPLNARCLVRADRRADGGGDLTRHRQRQQQRQVVLFRLRLQLSRYGAAQHRLVGVGHARLGAPYPLLARSARQLLARHVREPLALAASIVRIRVLNPQPFISLAGERRLLAKEHV